MLDKTCKTVVVIPAFNEETRIGKTVLGVAKYADRIIVVDDGSLDQTSSVAKSSGAHVVRYRPNRGMGNAIRLGLERAIGLNPEVIVLMDADGQHDPNYIPQFV